MMLWQRALQTKPKQSSREHGDRDGSRETT
jgi:hypothetical protein